VVFVNLRKEMEVLEEFVTERRQQRLRSVLADRTRNLVLLLEDIYDPHNASACVRSAEAMGVQELHVVCARYPFAPAPKVTNGADKWIDIHRHKSIAPCFESLKDRGFTIAAGVLNDQAVPIQEIRFDRPVALAFGNEHEGLSEEFCQAADLCFYIPMYGFSQSFNISVAAALGLHWAVNERIRLLGSSGDLAEEDREEILARWTRLSVPMADQILDRARKEEHTTG
jgi:tRNA (guanosine-2'-O-)-methyltransferase